MKFLQLILLTWLEINLLSCNPTIEKVEPVIIPSNWKTLTSKEYSIQYPKDWKLNKSGEMGTTFALFSEPTSSQDKFKENVNLVIQDFTGQQIDIQEYVDICENQIKQNLNKGKIIKSISQNLNNRNFHKLLYTGTQGSFDLKYDQYYWIENGKAYILTFTGEENEFADYKEIAEKILNSFLIKEK